MTVIAADLGGTKLALAAFSYEGRILRRQEVPLAGRQGRSVGALITAQACALRDAIDRDGTSVMGAGIGVPGIYRSGHGTVWAPNIPGWDDYPLLDEVRAALGEGVAVRIDSDRACCILGEVWQGSARGCRDAVFVTVGTGIGAGILVDGRVLRGHGDAAGAIGWLALDRPYRPEYGPVGCFEHHASGPGLVKAARERLREGGGATALRDGEAMTAADVFAAFDSGDPVAVPVVEDAVAFWGMAVANLVSLFNPERIVFGGGVFGPAARLLDAVREEALRWAQPVSIREVTLAVTSLGPDAALYGAARLALSAAGGSD
jgi:glucokinase